MSFPQIINEFIANVKNYPMGRMGKYSYTGGKRMVCKKNNVLVYPTGIIGVLLAAYVYFFQVYPPLYADGSLNILLFLL